jgi:hypothetical protein
MLCSFPVAFQGKASAVYKKVHKRTETAETVAGKGK